MQRTTNLDTNTENTYAETTDRRQTSGTKAPRSFPLHVSSGPGCSELLFWMHEGDMVTIITVNRKYFSG